VAARLVFRDEATFHLSSKINRWGSENLHQVIGHERDSPNINAFCAISQVKVYGPIFTTIVNVYLDMVHEDSPHFIFTTTALLLASTAK
jgi:hypothetical protein